MHQCQTGSLQNDQVIEASNGEESKIAFIAWEKRSPPNRYSKTKEMAATFYLRIMTSEKETVLLLNEWHNNLNNAVQFYEDADEIIQNDNLTRRIPEHLDNEDKLKFELIRQESTFSNDDFYKQYIEPDTLGIVRRESSEKEMEEAKYESIDLNDIYDYNDDFDEFSDDLDSLLLNEDIIPNLTKRK